MAITYDWQQKFNASGAEVKNRIDDPVDPEIIAELSKEFPDFVKACGEGGDEADTNTVQAAGPPDCNSPESFLH
jgi:hypothetical protein